MAEDDAPFLSRWARRKQAVREEDRPDEQTHRLQEAPEAAEPVESDRPLTPEEVEELPDPDTLGPGSDFKAFLREGVPEELKRRALRRLWRSNPVFGILDGLNDYDLDYTDAATVVANLQTVFKVGKGVVLPEEESKEEEVATSDTEAAPRSADLESAGDATLAGPAVGGEEQGVSGASDRQGAGLEPAADQRESEDPDTVLEVEQADSSTPLPQLSPGERVGVASPVERPAEFEKGRAARRRWGAFLPASDVTGGPGGGSEEV